LAPDGVNVAVTVVVAVGANVTAAPPSTNPSMSTPPPLKFVAAPQPVAAGVQEKVTVPVRGTPELPPDEPERQSPNVPLLRRTQLSVSTVAESVTFVPEATVMLVAGVIPEAPAKIDVVVGAANTVKFTGPTTVVPAQEPVVLLLAQ
jgi:hypothetical protein